jgi:hypothetical protein
MRIKTIIIVIIAVVLTIVLMQNRGPMFFSVLFFHMYISKLFAMLFVAIVAFVLGYLAGRPRRAIKLGGNGSDSDPDHSNPNTLSEEDKDYIN